MLQKGLHKCQLPILKFPSESKHDSKSPYWFSTWKLPRHIGLHNSIQYHQMYAKYASQSSKKKKIKSLKRL